MKTFKTYHILHLVLCKVIWPGFSVTIDSFESFWSLLWPLDVGGRTEF